MCDKSPPFEGLGKASMFKTPVHIISGFLGAGKTTAIIRLLEKKQPGECWAIVVNEFGKVSIDGQTLQSKSVNGSVFDITGGCICCSAKAYLHENLEKIVEAGKFGRIIIEPSGLGGIEMVSEIVASIPKLGLMPVIGLVDITGLENPRIQRNMIYLSQIRMSDRIVFSKCDLLDTADEINKLINRFIEMHPGKLGYIQGEDLSIDQLLPADPRVFDSQTTIKSYIPAHQLSASGYQEHIFQFPPDHLFKPEKLAALLSNHSFILRAKGFLCTATGWILFNHSMSGTQVSPCQPKEFSELVVIAEKSAVLHEFAIEFSGMGQRPEPALRVNDKR